MRDRLFFVEHAGPLPQDLGLLIRYQAADDRAFFKAHAELVKAQKERQKSEIGFVSQTADPVPPPAPEPVAALQKTPATASKTPEETSEIILQPDLTPAEVELAVPDGENFSQAA